MSYQVLARKWRPKNFAEVVGQEHILAALSNGLRENRLHHAYLFSGTRGVGKTSIARLFAKGLNCMDGVTAEPCGKCAHCKAIEEGNFIDLIEIDAASRTKVEDTRELLDNVQYKPVQGRYKVYLIDEVHMLSRHSFNALLKTLEEPPEYVKFLLATTDPQKLPVTILSRCMQFNLKALDQKQISHHLQHILKEEDIPYEMTALDKLAKAARGSIRDSLSLTDQAIAMSNGNISRDVVRVMLGLLDDNQPIEILYALQQGNGENLMKVIQAVADKGGNWDELLIEVGETLHQIAMQQLLPSTSNDETQIGFLAKHIAPEDVQLFYQIVVNGRKELAFAPNPRIGVEMTLLRALAFHPKLVQSQPSQQEQLSNVQTYVQSAVKKTENLVDMPVVSQSIKAKYESPAHSAAANAEQPSSAALSALEQIQKLRSQASGNGEKKNVNVTSSPLTETDSSSLSDLSETSPKVTALPVVTMQNKSKKQADLLDRLVNLSNSKNTETENAEDSAENTENDSEDETNLAETYRWEWTNPELAQEETAVRPSDIKKAILQEKTPEVITKVIAMADERDEWTKTVSQLHLDELKLVKQIALNSVVLIQHENEMKLGLRSAQKHLVRDKSVEILQDALTKFYGKTINLTIDFNDDESLFTPLDHRRQIYQELSEQAKEDLLKDKKVRLLQDMFDAKLDMDSIRPV
ncbi:DNA polymerase III subunit gamma/tau [Basfia succiniciproducens]|uniref:DNA polymerase III subunit gamma/tau n=1 Tax=Basfia succiniciproducens TaxID=653940 RepID=UPI003FCCB3CF